MKIAVDARFYGEAGPGRYVKNLLENLAEQDLRNDYFVFLNQRGFEIFNPSNPRFHKILVNCPWYSWQEQLVMLYHLLKVRPQLYYVPHFNVPVLYPGKLVVTLHDLIMHRFSTEQATTRWVWYYRLKRWVYRVVVAWACRRARKIIVPSQTVKKELVEEYPWLASLDKIVVIHEGVEPSFSRRELEGFSWEPVLERYGIKRPYLLSVSSFYPHKNTEAMVKALGILRDRFNFPGQLVLVGKQDFFSQRLQEWVEEEGLAKSVIFPNAQVKDKYITDEDLRILFAQATVYILASWQEGFSLTPLEAMRMKVPTVVSDIPVHREILGDAPLFFAPDDPEALVQRVREVLDNSVSRRKLMERGLKQVERYSWPKMAREVLEVFHNS